MMILPAPRSGEFADQVNGGCIHCVSATDLDDGCKLPGFLVQRIVKVCQCRLEAPLDLGRCGGVHSRGARVVRRVGHVHVVVRMDRRLRAKRAAEPEIGGVGNHFIDVHVGLRARSGLPHRQRKVLVQFAVSDVLSDSSNGRRTLAVERPKLAVDLGSRAFDGTERVHDPDRHALGTNTKVMQRPLGLCAPKPVGRNLERSEGVALNARSAGFTAYPGHPIHPRSSTRRWWRAIAAETMLVVSHQREQRYFLRKRSSRTTSPPPPLVGFSDFSRLETGAGERFGLSGSLAPTGTDGLAGKRFFLSFADGDAS